MSFASILLLVASGCLVAVAVALIVTLYRVLRNPAVRMLIDERTRQVEREGWTPEHDDEHARGEMAAAAACYAMPNDVRGELVPTSGSFRVSVRDVVWPWGSAWWKPVPNNRVHELVKAGALIIAEIERELRAQKRAAKGGR